MIIYAGSLVNPALLDYRKETCRVYDSAKMTLEEVLSIMFEAEAAGLDTVRLHTGDPCLYGAIREQMDELDKRGVAYDYCPGVSAFSGAAAALKMEGVHPAGYLPERRHHPHGGSDPGARAGERSVLRRPRGHHGAVFERGAP